MGSNGSTEGFEFLLGLLFLRVFGVVLKPLRFIYIRNLKNSQKSGNLKKIVQNEENTLEKS